MHRKCPSFCFKEVMSMGGLCITWKQNVMHELLLALSSKRKQLCLILTLA